MAELTSQQQSLFMEMVKARVSKLKRVSGNEWIGCCPAHDDQKPSWGFNELTALHNCHSCSFGGNAVVLAKHFNEDPKPFYSADYQSGTGSLVEKVPVVVEPPDAPHDKPKKPPSKPLSYDKVEDWDLVPLPDEKMRQNWNVEAVSELQVHWSKKYGGLVFLVLDSDYEFIGAYIHKPEKGNTRFTVGVKSQVYPIFLFKDYSPLKPLFLVEGLVDVPTLRAKGHQVGSFTAGAMSTPRDLSWLEPWNHTATAGVNESTVWGVTNPVIICYDNDETGRKGAVKQALALKKRFPNMTVLVCDWGKLPASLPAGCDVTDIDHGQFQDLIKSAVPYRLKKIGGFEVMSGTEYQDLEPEPIEFIIEHLLPMNFNTITAGETGANKSWYAMQKAMSIANNESQFLGFKILKKNLKVLYIDTEIGKQLMHNRYKELLKNFKPWNGGSRFTMMSMDGSTDNLWADIDEAVAILKPDYVVIDCLYNVNQWGGDLGKAPDMTKITTALSRLRSKFNITVESIAHFIKGLKESGLDSTRVAGSQALQNWVQHMILIINVPTDDALRFMKIAKARTAHYPRDTFALEWHHKDQWLTMRGIVEDPTKYLMSLDEVNKMYGLIANIRERVDKDGFFPTEMAYNAGDELEISRSTTRRHLKSAVTAGLVADEGYGKWRLTGLQTIEFDKYESDEE